MGVLGVGLAACHGSRPSDPATVLRSIRHDFFHGSLETARLRAQRARLENTPSADPAGEWGLKFRLLEAEILGYQGRQAEVLDLLDHASLQSVAGDLAIKAHLLRALADEGLEHSAASRSELLEARRRADSEKSALLGEVLRTEALITLDQDRLAEAIELFGKSRDIARTQGDAYLEATDLLNIGFATLQLQHYDEAIDLLREAARFAEPIEARTVLEAALGNIGEAYLRLGDFERSLDYYVRAEALAEEIGTSSAQVDWLRDIGYCHFKLGNLAEARRYDERALQAAKELRSDGDAAGIQTNLAFLLLRQGDYPSAVEYSNAAVLGSQGSGDPSDHLSSLFVQALVLERLHDWDGAERQLLEVHGHASSDAWLRWDVENALGALNAGRGRAAAAQQWYRRSIDTFENERAAVGEEASRLSFFANGDTLYRDYAQFLIDLGQSGQALALLDRGRARTLEERRGPPAAVASRQWQAALLDPRQVARQVGGCILFYELGAEQSHLWAINAGRVVLYVLPKGADIEALVARYQKSILRSGDPLREANPSAIALYDQLIAPAAAMIADHARVFLIRDGALNRLNFETLLASRGGLHYWIDDVTAANASSIALLARRQSGPPPSGGASLLMIGDPVSAGRDYERLPSAAAEIDAVQNHFGVRGKTLVTGTSAVPAAYASSQPEQFTYIHFVAHGTASHLDPLSSAVVLSPPDGHPDDFRLYARDIAEHPLNARLVTISACYGSGLRAYSGEGLVGLAWAFLRAGSRDVIGASWEANDASTPLLMDRLYAGIAQGAATDEALRGAKLALLHSTSVYRKPFYWGAFQLYSGS
jgi:CHAT domain-containing protein